MPEIYPSVRYHWTKGAYTVKSAEEEIALGGGCARTPAAFHAYQGVRPARTREQNPVKWLEQFQLPRLSSEHRKKIQAVLLRADATFERAVDPDVGAVAAMRQAFGGIAQVLFEGVA